MKSLNRQIHAPRGAFNNLANLFCRSAFEHFENGFGGKGSKTAFLNFEHAKTLNSTLKTVNSAKLKSKLDPIATFTSLL